LCEERANFSALMRLRHPGQVARPPLRSMGFGRSAHRRR